MQPTKEIIGVWDWLMERSERAAMATVVRTSGSTYRKIGARMGVSDDGETHGAVSAGCLERDVTETSLEVIRGGLPRLLHYDNSSEEDIIWGLGLGCNGVVDILVQPFAPVHPVYAAASDALVKGETAVVSTAIEAPEGGPPVGSAVCTLPRQSIVVSSEETPGPTNDRLKNGPTGVVTDTAHPGVVWCVERLEPQQKVIILGADPDSIPLAGLASKAGFHVSVVDHRSTHASPARYPLADHVVLCRPSELAEHIVPDPATLIVVKTHNYIMDREYLQQLLPSSACYVGQMGPRSRMERLLGDMRSSGFEPTEAQLSRLHAPIGLDLNAETAEQVAMSIVAELIAVAGGRAGGQLCTQTRDIHPRSE